MVAASVQDEPRQVMRLPRLTEEDILDRIEQLQEHLRLPEDVWTVLVEILCPDSHEDPPPPPEPTQTLPGTEARLRVMLMRAEQGYGVFHPDDLTWEADITDRLAIAGCRLRNGVASRMDAPMVRRGFEGDSPAPQVEEGFVVPATLVAGKVAPAKPKKKKNGESPDQKLLFG